MSELMSVALIVGGLSIGGFIIALLWIIAPKIDDWMKIRNEAIKLRNCRDDSNQTRLWEKMETVLELQRLSNERIWNFAFDSLKEIANNQRRIESKVDKIIMERRDIRVSRIKNDESGNGK